jgi:cation-transporting ATPase 13A3/4/5
VVRRFEFSSALQRNLVVLKNPHGSTVEHVVYAKGSPEMIRTLVRPMSIPADFDKVGEKSRLRGVSV